MNREKKNRTLKTVINTVNKKALIEKGDKVLVAFSGGADSVCLLYILNRLKEELRFELFAVHLNHGLRGDSADNDARFCEDFCKSLGVELEVFKKNVREYSAVRGISEELAGREIRYSLFFDVMKKKGLNKLAVAHHADDQAETVMQHLMRGSGIDGLSGIRYERDSVIRPLLDITKDEILEFCTNEHLDYCTDETNFETVYTRNKVRLELIPKMREFNPNLSKTISGMTQILADEADFLNKEADVAFKNLVDGEVCDKNALMSTHTAIRRRVIRKMIENVRNTKKDISADCIEKIMKLIESGTTGKELVFGECVVRLDYEKLTITKKTEEKNDGFSYEVFLDKKLHIAENGLTINIEENETGDFDFPEKAELLVRSRQPGDRIYPLGMSGSKKLKNLFIDEKVTRDDREKAAVLVCNEQIAAVFYSGKCFFDRRFYKKGKGKFCVEVK